MTIYDFKVRDTKGQDVPMDSFKGKVLLIVNTATACGFTPQYAGLQKLYGAYSQRGFEVLDFPCNQFAHQAPGTANEIDNFCAVNFGTMFPRFEKVEVNGKNESPLYGFLKSRRRGFLGSKNIKWNFTKFLIDRNGNVVGRYGPTEKPEAMEADIKKILG